MAKVNLCFSSKRKIQFIFAALFEFLMSHIFHRKKLDDFGAENLTKITTNVKIGEDGLVEQLFFVGWKDRPCREKKLKIALLKKTVFEVKFKFEGRNCALQISAHQFFGWNIWQSSTRPFFLTFCSEIKKKSKICFFQPRQIYLEYLGAIKMRDKDKISIWNIWLWIKWETKFQNS